MKMHNVIARAQHMLGGNTYIGVLGVFSVPGVSVAPGVPGVPGFPMQCTYLLHYTYAMVELTREAHQPTPELPRSPYVRIRTSAAHVFHFPDPSSQPWLRANPSSQHKNRYT